MSKLSFTTSLLLALILGFCEASVRAQELEMVAPPIPAILPPSPPDPYNLPAPPELQWESLTPKGSEEEQPPGEVIDVPPPATETALPQPPPAMLETPLPGIPDPADLERAKPDVEVWRPQSEWPQVPPRRSNRLDLTYVSGTEPATLRVQFDPLLAGKSVYVRPGIGIALNPPAVTLTVPATGELIIVAQIAVGTDRSHLTFYCEGVKTVLPVLRAPERVIIQAEEETGK